MNITVTQVTRIEGDWLAVCEGNLELRATGHSVEAAIGALIKLHSIEFGIVLVMKQDPHEDEDFVPIRCI